MMRVSQASGAAPRPKRAVNFGEIARLRMYAATAAPSGAERLER